MQEPLSAVDVHVDRFFVVVVYLHHICVAARKVSQRLGSYPCDSVQSMAV